MKRDLFLSVVTIVAVLFAWSAAFADYVPEFDTVGCDSNNYFVDPVMREVIANNILFSGEHINSYSNFSDESFITTAGPSYPDPCFTYNGTYYSALTTPSQNSYYEWNIVLQMKPASDINLEIRDCVLRDNGYDIWADAWQTGRFITYYGQNIFVDVANPTVTVTALPGPFATTEFDEFFLEGRLGGELGGTQRVILNEVLYSSKSLWSENLLIALPETGDQNSEEQPMYSLNAGDIIKVRIDIPSNNLADIRYGKDNVILKYNGIVGTWYLSEESCVTKVIKPVLPLKPIIEIPRKMPLIQ